MAGVPAAVGGGWSGSDSATSASVGGITVCAGRCLEGGADRCLEGEGGGGGGGGGAGSAVPSSSTWLVLCWK